jgi:hypothetical protein
MDIQKALSEVLGTFDFNFSNTELAALASQR